MLPDLAAADRALVLMVTCTNVTYLIAHYACTRWGILRGRYLRGAVLLFGGALALVLAGEDLGAYLPLWRSEAWVVLAAVACGSVVLPGAWIGATKPNMAEHMPEIREPFTPSLKRHAVLAWAVYLFGYEFFFRSCIQGFLTVRYGLWPALALTTALYTWSHMHKAWTETFGSVLMGFVFGLMAHFTGGFFAPFLLHLLIGAGSELAAAKSLAKRQGVS